MTSFNALPEQREFVKLDSYIGRDGQPVIVRGRHLRFLLPEEQRADGKDALAQLGTGAWVRYDSRATEIDAEYAGL